MESNDRTLLLVMGGLLLVSFAWEGLILLAGGVAGPYFTLMATALMFFPTVAGLLFLRRT